MSATRSSAETKYCRIRVGTIILENNTGMLGKFTWETIFANAPHNYEHDALSKNVVSQRSEEEVLIAEEEVATLLAAVATLHQTANTGSASDSA